MPTLVDPNGKLGNYASSRQQRHSYRRSGAAQRTAANASRVFGDPNPAFTGTITGVKNGDNITATYASAADPTSPVGNYAIIPDTG